MRWATSIAAAALLAGCGNYSTEDLEFHEALPGRETLAVALPGGASSQAAQASGAQAAVACGDMGAATISVEARAMGLAINSGLDWILRVVDHVRSLEPTRRARDSRTWGPFPDQSHPGFQSRIRVTRSHEGDLPVYAFFLESLAPGAADWATLITGHFFGAYAASGHGDITLHFGTIRQLGLSEQPTDPETDVPIAYDRTRDPGTIRMTIPAGQDGFGLTPWTYEYRRYQDGRGALGFARRSLPGDLAVWTAGFNAAGAGIGHLRWYAAGVDPTTQLPTYSAFACWDANACYSAAYDLLNVLGLCTSSPCIAAWPDGCPAGLPQ